MQRRVPDDLDSSEYERCGKKEQCDQHRKRAREQADDRDVTEGKFNEGGAAEDESDRKSVV